MTLNILCFSYSSSGISLPYTSFNENRSEAALHATIANALIKAPATPKPKQNQIKLKESSSLHFASQMVPKL